MILHINQYFEWNLIMSVQSFWVIFLISHALWSSVPRWHLNTCIWFCSLLKFTRLHQQYVHQQRVILTKHPLWGLQALLPIERPSSPWRNVWFHVGVRKCARRAWHILSQQNGTSPEIANGFCNNWVEDTWRAPAVQGIRTEPQQTWSLTTMKGQRPSTLLTWEYAGVQLVTFRGWPSEENQALALPAFWNLITLTSGRVIR